ncbi:hypothetical protein AJ80_00123 [Polytolypa hystricis UAMH7299]|uniref:carnosine N-methyltransferase n=1 Tax=Polytolypa hystricis (strain UAMH7299) TaxID=1447883 RepID=A0A2B7Z5C2_POLH7|nr:hypothetical protein AJ80_00123 [Polytolypa hystricis UAMH7299]
MSSAEMEQPALETEEVWAGEFDPLADPEERRVLFAALDSFRQYRRTAHSNTTHRRRQEFYALPSLHRQMLTEPPFSMLEAFNQVDDAIDASADLADAILASGLEAFGLPVDPNDDNPRTSWHNTATSSDVNKAHSTVRQFYRDWSAEGSREREICYDPVMRDIQEIFPNKPHHEIHVLVPGAGLGRLVFDLCAVGYTAEGNEISYHQLLASSWVLNHSAGLGEFALYPFALQFSNLRSRRQQLVKVMIPDVHPGTLVTEQIAGAESGRIPGSMSMSAADFIVAYGSPSNKESYDVVATIFFIDTAPNLIRYIETIHNCLKPGGAWINIGPLLWHFEDKPLESSSHEHTHSASKDWDKQHQGIAEPGRVEFTEEEILILLDKMGFQIVKRDSESRDCGYIQDPESMLQNLYRPSHWVAIKKTQ